VDRGFSRVLPARVLAPFVAQRMRAPEMAPNQADLLALTKLIESGKLTPMIDRTYPLSEAPEAIRYLQEGHARGKIVIRV
jgi:NADPH:quinone reductase-like Zn-dependent oxidoreductase